MNSMTSRVAPGTRIANRFTVCEMLGCGGQGEVWMAFDDREAEAVALKILVRTFAADGDPLTVLRREHALVCELDHPGILKTYPPVCAGDLAVLPMRLATGGDLRQLRGAPYVEIIPPLIELAQALDYAHAHGVVHRDLKAANVLFDSLGRVQLADFGVAARVQAGLPVDAERTGCSPSTASPQQLFGPAAFSFR